ncbi:MAG: YqgE/AlgH family protein [Lentisphaeria bacterium]|nr:YqgE/AlgH family protein [Lentisphaeria bacterium]
MQTSVKRGDLLIASASLVDPNFVRSVVLVCDHSDASGTFGLILNRPIAVPEALKKSLPFPVARLYQGGPVRLETMQVIHPYGQTIPQSLEVLPGTWVGGDFGIMQEGFREGRFDPDRCRFCLGYSGWGEGQLAGEFEQDAWLLAEGSADLVFQTPVTRLWAQAVRAYGCSHPMFRHFPDDPSYN